MVEDGAHTNVHLQIFHQSPLEQCQQKQGKTDSVASDLGRRPFWLWSRPFSGDLGGHGQLLPFA